MIPVRVRSDAKPVLASDRRFAARRGHPIDSDPCPVCDGPLGDRVTVLVFVGIAPEDRKPGGYTTGGAVAVHAACAGVPDEGPILGDAGSNDSGTGAITASGGNGSAGPVTISGGDGTVRAYLGGGGANDTVTIRGVGGAVGFGGPNTVRGVGHREGCDEDGKP